MFLICCFKVLLNEVLVPVLKLGWVRDTLTGSNLNWITCNGKFRNACYGHMRLQCEPHPIVIIIVICNNMESHTPYFVCVHISHLQAVYSHAH